MIIMKKIKFIIIASILILLIIGIFIVMTFIKNPISKAEGTPCAFIFKTDRGIGPFEQSYTTILSSLDPWQQQFYSLKLGTKFEVSQLNNDYYFFIARCPQHLSDVPSSWILIPKDYNPSYCISNNDPNIIKDPFTELWSCPGMLNSEIDFEKVWQEFNLSEEEWNDTSGKRRAEMIANSTESKIGSRERLRGALNSAIDNGLDKTCTMMNLPNSYYPENKENADTYCGDGICQGQIEKSSCSCDCVNEQESPLNFTCENLLNNGNPKNKVDIVFVADNYTNLNQWIEDVQNFTDLNGNDNGFFSVEPMKSEKSKFNVWRVDTINQTFMDFSYGYEQLTPEAKKKAQDYAIRCANDYDMIFLVVDGRRFGLGIYGSNMTPFGRLDYQGDHENEHLAKGMMLHEFGHAFVNLGDEYPNSFTVFYGPNRSNLDVEGCPKWCSGELNQNAECYDSYMEFRTCLYNLTNNLTNPENYQNSYNPPYIPCSPHPDSAECDLGTGCRSGTGCYWNGHGLTSFMSSKISIMTANEEAGFNLISQETIQERINQIVKN